MSKGHTAVNEFLEKKERYADFFNGNFFQGQQIILPEELDVIKGESDILVEDKDENVKEVHRYRDIVMRWKKGIYLVILACETQSEVHYAMPVRKMLYDSLSYVDQVKKTWEAHQRDAEKRKLTNAEYLSKFRKDDKLIPVITAVFYYGTKEWDGSVDLYGMFEDNEFLENDVMRKYIPNYWINLIDAGSVENIECFQTDLKEIFGMMKCRKDEKALIDYMRENEAYFRHVDNETYRAIDELLQSKQILDTEVSKEEMEGERDMCKALEDLYQHGVGDGENKKLTGQVEKKLRKGLSVPEIAEMLEENEKTIEEIVKNLEN